ncbi:MAG: hypothetical protein PHD74_03625 [Candidatus Krumholzibacteria bacterium]|nr:hypothetical protein [Candidatus Krumholzibacteria bacterium]
MIHYTCLLALAALVGMVEGRSKRNPLDCPPKGALQYSGYDKNGEAIVRGWIFFSVGESADIDGEWCLDRVGTPGDIGPQLGLGALSGRLEGSSLFINLNPGYTDFNVFLAGTFDGTTYKGKWRYSRLRGAVNEGTFAAALMEQPGDADRTR